MTTGSTALLGARIFDGEAWHDDAALLIEGDSVTGIVPVAELSRDVSRVDAGGGLLVPGFVDLQVNGGGGIMFNDKPDVATIETICKAQTPYGTTALLPTLITDTPQVTAAVLAAGAEAWRRRVPGFLGLHLEGPHLAPSRKGAHDPALIRPMVDADLATLVAAGATMPVLMTTVATEAVTPQQIAALAGAGVHVSLGHTDASFAAAEAAVAAGARLATHLFNAMSQIGNREPGLAGAVLDLGDLSAGFIADGVHVDPATLGIALRSKRGPGRLFLVTDAMATIGSDISSFTLNGRTIYRKDGRLTLADGTLAGADLDMISAVRFVHRRLGVPLEETLRMASLYPAQAVGQDMRHGRLAAGSAANVVALSPQLHVKSVWLDGVPVYGAARP